MTRDDKRSSIFNKDIMFVSIRDLLSLDQMHRNTGSIEQFLKDSELKEQSWNNALDILQTWIALREAISKYVLWNESSALPEIKSHLNSVLRLLSELIFFHIVERPKFLKPCFVGKLGFDRPLYRYQGWD